VKALRAEKQTRNSTRKEDAAKKSPSKSALRGNSLSPTKTPMHKRKVVFSPTKPNKDDDSSGVEDTPSKRQKFSSPTKSVTRSGTATFQDTLRGHASSSKTTLDVSQSQIDDDGAPPDDDETSEDYSQVPPTPSDHSSNVGNDTPDVEMSDAYTVSEVASDIEAVPVTPRRSHRQTKSPFTNPPTTPRSSAYSRSPSKTERFKAVRAYEDGEAEHSRRRSRPVLLEHRQWTLKDPKAEREFKIREQWVREMIEKRGGHPFEDLRAGRIV
jgi:hypothetical protein